ncbi:DUF2971 domain-containing protein [Microvirga sp. CF3062]|uniref:DUF2971 domain-containing protein n=1 Tax=Microvirga sp. CF3062 TaxID=3110182 RepID=UPI002E7A451B|nr:DUF2971 domain-containing protein [Microvirga sp. CF3062]MEE1656740.1 DUF2971 domain-containing protein [Microvirga sp. CF3062]
MASGKTKVLKRYTSLSSAMDMLFRRKLTFLSPSSWQDKNDTEYLEYYRKRRGFDTIHALCFTETPETFHHWQVFAGNNEGVCIEFSKELLIKKLQEEEFQYGKVEYLKLVELKELGRLELKRLPYLKRWGFRDEKEFRAFKGGHEIEADLPNIDIDLSWIQQIRLNPWLKENLADGIKVALRSFPDCNKLKVTRSSLTDNAQWKQEVKRAIGGIRRRG